MRNPAVPETRSRYAALVADHRTKWDQDNAAPLNPWAFFATAVLILFLVGLGVLFAVT